MDKIKTISKGFVDGYSRERIFYGVNFGSKNIPLSKAMPNYGQHIPHIISYFKEHGFNVIRYLLNWQYLEPEPDCYSTETLDDIREFLDLCEKNNIYVILDMHQDLFGQFTNRPLKKNELPFGNGAPYWACVTDGETCRKHKMIWAAGYFKDKAIHNAFDNFWLNTEVFGKGLQDRFCDLWRLLAREFGDHPAVLGFDILNEPFMGSDGGKIFKQLVKSTVQTSVKSKALDKKALVKSVFTKNPVKNVLDHFSGDVLNEITAPCLELVKKFDEENYFPFINKVAAAIRAETENGIIFKENCYYSNLGIPCSAPPIEINGAREEKQAFAPHAYDFMVDTPIYKYASNSRIEAIFQKRREEQLQLDIPVLVGEWGGGGKFGDWLDHGEFILNLFDSFKWSSTYWGFNMNSPVIKMLCRAHPVAVCGEIKEYHFNKKKQQFCLSFHQNKAFDVPTEIFCHKRPAVIEASGRYELEQLSAYTYMLRLFTEQGENEIKIQF